MRRPNGTGTMTARPIGRSDVIEQTSRDSEALATVLDQVQRRLLAEISPTTDMNSRDQVLPTIDYIFNEVVKDSKVPLSRADKEQLRKEVIANILGYGPLEPLLEDETITEILVNGPNQVFIERRGRLTETDITFKSNAELMRIVDRIVTPLGRRVDESSPMVDARLPDGSRVNIIIPPLCLNGPTISIRKFAKNVFTEADMLRMNTVNQGMVDFLRACVLGRTNIVVSGGTGTGKTTLLNMLSNFLPSAERIVTIEDSAELQLNQRHLVRLEARPPNIEGKGQVTIRQLVINALRMRPDRIIVGEVRGGEALDMLQAMNTGHDGSMTTAHSNSARDTLSRVETMVLMAGTDMPMRAIREQIASAFDMVVHLERMSDGSRKVVQITEVQGLEGDIVVMQDIFRFEQTGVSDGKVEGIYTPTGIRPKFVEQFPARGIPVQPEWFTPERMIMRRHR
ncbi:MAG: CpaF family protein [Anaerolineae bacterium]